jgi:cytochrome c-type biogenesis protein
MHQDISFLVAFGAGILSFITPCVLPLIPPYISYITGLTIDELKNESGMTPAARNRLLLNSLIFVLGFMVVFILLGAAATAIGSFLLKKSHILSRIAGVIIVIFGLHMTGIIRLNFLLYEKRFDAKVGALSFFPIFIMGAAFAFGWTPCIGPILAGILAYAGTQQQLWRGILLLLAFSLGLGIPFVLTALAINRFFAFFIRIKKYFRAIEIVSGILLIGIGVLIFFGSLSIIGGLLVKWFPFLGNLG